MGLLKRTLLHFLTSDKKPRADIQPIPTIKNGDIEWRLPNGFRHREDGPAVIRANGTREWYQNSELHRDDGPALEYADGSKEWYHHGQLHREDGPAAEYAKGSKVWWRNGDLHRTDGPALEWANGDKEWWLNGVRVTKDQFDRHQNSPVLNISIVRD